VKMMQGLNTTLSQGTMSQTHFETKLHASGETYLPRIKGTSPQMQLLCILSALQIRRADVNL
jgi:hypothetical protein